MEKTFITINSKQTQKLGELLVRELKGGEILCLDGELGAGKTTFTQGLLKGLKVKGPYTSPTFLIMKQYHIACNMKHETKKEKMFHVSCFMFHDVYHFDAYRVEAQDILNLGWEEIIANPKNIVIIEWASRIKNIIPSNAIWIEFFWLGEKERKIIFKSKV
ncbi:MAG: tRNA (adenosine(37)-N6)-threonylcarbamoyltransferase complex ATPase subunit type 1 TsaE [Candidatus Moraniibacteriota bacterium]